MDTIASVVLTVNTSKYDIVYLPQIGFSEEKIRKIVKNCPFWLVLGPFLGHFLSQVFTVGTFFHGFEQFFTYNRRFDMFYANLMVM